MSTELTCGFMQGALAFPPVDRRDDYGSWQETGGQGDRWSYGSDRYGGDDRFGDERVPEPRHGGGSPMSGPPMSGPPMSGPPMSGPPMRGRRSGEPLPPALDPLFDPMPDPRSGLGPADPRGPMQQPPPPGFEPTGAVDAAAVRRKVKETDGLYRSRKPIFIALYGVLAAIAEILMLRPFFAGVGESAVLGPLLAMFAFPLLAIGMYGLSTGAATAVQFQGPRVWLRLPLAYLPIGIGLLIAAGTAVK